MTRWQHHSHYIFDGREEPCLCAGPSGAIRRYLIIPPLFDEMNRVRAMLMTAMLYLGEKGVATILPDLPGCNESLSPISEQTLTKWRAAMDAAAGQQYANNIVSIRGGALIDGMAGKSHWRLAPAKGASLLKTMLRTRIASDKESGRTSTIESLMAEAKAGPIELSGYMLSADMLRELDAALPDPSVEAEEISVGEGPDQLWGKPIWLRAEPQEDRDMSGALAQALYRWKLG